MLVFWKDLICVSVVKYLKVPKGLGFGCLVLGSFVLAMSVLVSRLPEFPSLLDEGVNDISQPCLAGAASSGRGAEVSILEFYPFLGVSAHQSLCPSDVVLGICHMNDIWVYLDWGVVIIKEGSKFV